MSAHTRTANTLVKPLLLLGLFIVTGLILSIAVPNVLAAVESHPAASGVEAGLLQARQADAARYTGLAANYAARQAANLQRARMADAARWNLMAENFAARQPSNLERARMADAARYTALAAYYDAREAANLERSRIADAARWNLMAKYFAANP